MVEMVVGKMDLLHVGGYRIEECTCDLERRDATVDVKTLDGCTRGRNPPRKEIEKHYFYRTLSIQLEVLVVGLIILTVWV